MPIKDSSLLSQYIRKIENPDSLGYKNGRWYASPYDANARGFGVDIVRNDKARKVAQGRSGNWLSEKEERTLRNNYIGELQNTIERRHLIGVRATPLTDRKRMVATGLLYRGDGINGDPKLSEAYYTGTDEDFEKAVEDYYLRKGLKERARLHREFVGEHPAKTTSFLDSFDWNNNGFNYNQKNKFSGGGYVYDVLPKMLKEAGLNVKVTSGYRKPGQAGKAGNKSWHTHHGAVDIVPQGKTTFEDIENALYNNPTISRYMMDNGFGLLDESGRTTESKATMRKTGATGAHFHIGKDTAGRKAYTAKMSSLWDSRMKQLHQAVAAPEEQIAFMPANPEVFFSPPASFKAPGFETPPVDPTVATTLQRQDKEVERQDRLRGLSLLNWVLNGAPFPLSV